MKPKLIVLTPAVIVATLSLPALAEDRNPAQPAPRQATAGQVNRPVDTAPLRMLIKASDILGLEVRNYQDEKLGKVDDLVVDVGPERVTGLVVSVGGVLGVGDKPVIIPMSAFHYDSEKKLLHLDSTKDALKSSPRFEIGKWQEFQQQAEVAEVYRYYRTTPYFTEGGTINYPSPAQVDGSAKPLTPVDQGNNARDLQITAQIRKDLLRQPGLSVSGQNVKIITTNGRVTLRGSVDSGAERETIQRLAEAVAPNQIDNQLEVVATNK